MQDFFQILTNFGFPIALSCYLLLRFEKILDGLQKIIADLVVKNTDLSVKNETLINEVKELKEIISRRKK